MMMPAGSKSACKMQADSELAGIPTAVWPPLNAPCCPCYMQAASKMARIPTAVEPPLSSWLPCCAHAVCAGGLSDGICPSRNRLADSPLSV